MRPQQSAHNDRIKGGPATRRIRYPGEKDRERWRGWQYNSTADLQPGVEVQYWNPETGRWE